MRRVGILLMLAGCAVEPSTTPVETTTNDIRNGTRDPEAIALSDGQLLALGWLHSRGREDSPFCTGTLITPRIVATAKHCVDGSTRRLAFGVGQLPTDPVATFAVANVVPHPSVDAALLVLAEDATDRLPQLVPIPHNQSNLTDAWLGREVQAGGYGETYDRSRFGRYFATVELVDIRDRQITVDGRGIQGICFGDSGGPVFSLDDDGNIVVVAVESTGDASCVGRDEMVRLDRLHDWILSVAEGRPPPDECDGIDFLGRCTGLLAEWCEGGQLQSVNCAERGRRCGYIDDSTGYFCEEPSPCGEVEAEGQCEEQLVVRCRFGRLAYEDCAADGARCAIDRAGAHCTSVRPDGGSAEPDVGVDAGPDAEIDASDAPESDAVVTGPQDANLPADPPETVISGGSCASTPSDNPVALPFWLAMGLLITRRRR